MHAVAISADGDLLVVLAEECFAVFAGFVTFELVGRQAVGIHLAHVAVATGAQFRDGALVREAGGVTGMAVGAFELRMNAGGDFVGHVRVRGGAQPEAKQNDV